MLFLTFLIILVSLLILFGFFMYKLLSTLTLCLMYSATFAEVSAPITGTLTNGLDYTIVPLHDEKNRVEIRLRVEAGAVDEKDNQAGVAHMVEHLVFRGSEKYPDGIMDNLHKQGWVRAKNYNAVTTPDSTTYLMTPPTKTTLDDALAILSQMMFSAKLTQTDLDKERQIILEEWRGGQGVAARMDEQRKSVIRANSRYIRSPVIGTKDSINTMPAKELQDFYQTWYAPNNMNLVIVGDISPETAKRAIDNHFGQIPQKSLPVRDYLEPKLSNKLTVKQLQDEQSGVSQVAYIVRFSEPQSLLTDDQARKNRLIDRFALTFITKRLQNELKHLPQGVNSVVARKSDIGKQTAALGIFASVDKTSHKQGLAEVFYQIERLKRYPITQAEFDDYKKDMQLLLDKASNHNNDRDFAGWMQAMATTVLMDKAYLSQPQIAKLTQPLLDSLTPEDIQNRVNQWLNAPDRIVQYQAPHKTQISPIGEADVLDLQKKAQNSTISPPNQKPIIEAMQLDKPTDTATIDSIKFYKAQNVYEYTLNNQERIVWLKSDVAGDKTYFQAVNHSGILADKLNPWQSQLAVQLISQNAPKNYQLDNLNEYKKIHKVALSVKQSEYYLTIEGSSPNQNIDKLLNLYQALMNQTTIKDEFNDAVSSLQTTLDKQANPNVHAQTQRQELIAKLRSYQADKKFLPTQDELNSLTVADLQQQWQIIQNTPTTYYIVSNISPIQMKEQIEQYFSAKNKPIILNTHQNPSANRNQTLEFAYNIEPKNDIQMWSSTPHAWQGQDAMLVSVTKILAQEKLKAKLRDEKLGIYRLSFDSALNADTGQIESYLKFTTDPKKSNALIIDAKAVLANLPSQITQKDIDKIKAGFLLQEKERLKRPETWMNRLILSDRYYHNPSYLSDMITLTETITLQNVQNIAKELYNPDNTQIFIDTPKNP